MLFDIESLKSAYYFSLSNESLKDLCNELDNMEEKRPRFKMKLIKSNSDYIRVDYLMNMKVKKVRKNLINIEYDKIKEFNEILKLSRKNKWIHYFHNKDNWINELLLIIKSNSVGLFNYIENYAGNDDYEMRRLESNYNIVKNVVFTSWYHSDSFDNKEWSSKLNCICKSELIEGSRIIFKVGDAYEYRIKSDGVIIVYYYEFSSLIFEGDEFYHYFNSPESRERNINSLLGL